MNKNLKNLNYGLQVQAGLQVVAGQVRLVCSGLVKDVKSLKKISYFVFLC
jgi:hypothetical protein